MGADDGALAPLVAGALAPAPSVGAALGAVPWLVGVPPETVPVVGPAPAPVSGLAGAVGALEAGGVTMTTGGAAAGGGVATTTGAGAGWTGAD